MSVSVNVINENGIDMIYISDYPQKYNISVLELRDYLKSKMKIQNELIILQEPNETEPDDIFLKLNDNQLLINFKNLLSKSKTLGIQEYYNKNHIVYRNFNSRGLIYNNKIMNESNRKTIREMCRKCFDFIHSKEENKKVEPELVPKEENKKVEPELVPKEENKKVEPELVPKEDQINENKQSVVLPIFQTCLYEFKRGPSKGKLCGKHSLENHSYCSLCIDKVNEKIKLQQNLLTPLYKYS